MDPDAAEGLESGVPRILWSVQSEKPFSRCIDCGCEFESSGIPYAVEKAVRQGEVVFEYAICVGCTALLMKEFSEESLRNISAYLEEEELDFQQPLGLSSCHRCGAAGPEFGEEHTVTGMLVGDRMLMGPSIVCGRCLEGIDAVLSQKTRDAHGEFIRNNFPGVSDAFDLPVSVLGTT